MTRSYRRYPSGDYCAVSREEWISFMREHGGDVTRHLGLMFGEGDRRLACFVDGGSYFIHCDLMPEKANGPRS